MFFHKKKNNSHISYIIFFGVLSVMFLGFIIYQISPEYKIISSKVTGKLTSAGNSTPLDPDTCHDGIDPAANFASSTILPTPSNRPHPDGFIVTLYLKNHGNEAASNVQWELVNQTTGKRLKSATVKSLNPCSKVKIVSQEIIKKAYDNTDLKIFEGENLFRFRIVSASNDKNKTNNSYVLKAFVPTVDLWVNPAGYQVQVTKSATASHSLSVRNSGTVESLLSHNSVIEFNGTVDGSLMYGSIPPSSSTAISQRVYGKTPVREGYNFVRVSVDTPSKVIEVNESRRVPETNNLALIEFFYDKQNNAVKGLQGYKQENPNWFMYSPTFTSGSGFSLLAPVLNISNSKQTFVPRVSVLLDSCTGQQIKSYTHTGNVSVEKNASNEFYLKDFTDSMLQQMDGHQVCVSFSDGKNSVSRIITVQFSDLSVTSYGAYLTDGQSGNLKTTVNNPYTQYSERGLKHTITIKNNAKGRASNFKVSVYINGSYEGSTSIQSLENGQSQSVTIPPATRAFLGMNVVKVLVDSDSQITETNETNNSIYSQVLVDQDQVVAGYPKNI